MKKILLGLCLFFSVFLLSGCFNQGANKPDNPTTLPVDSSTTNSVEPVKTSVKTVNKFYPDLPVMEKTSTGIPAEVTKEPEDFVVTQEWQAKIYLADKYNPGICYGLPTPVPQVAIDGVIAKNPGLVAFIRGKYNLTSDLDVYNKMRQFNGIGLEKIADGHYIYTFKDGQCCVLTAYQGDITIVGQTIADKIIQQETRQNPC